MKILFFGIAKDIVGKSIVEFQNEILFPIKVGTLKADLINKYPALGDISSLAIALNSRYATDDMLVSQQDEIAIIPPVSGG
ncbi:MAG: MoaD/ThiS family protein [Flavobacteriaceae bacterium]|jgi:molybdopterin synthase sulfur carrier subunit